LTLQKLIYTVFYNKYFPVIQPLAELNRINPFFILSVAVSDYFRSLSSGFRSLSSGFRSLSSDFRSLSSGFRSLSSDFRSLLQSNPKRRYATDPDYSAKLESLYYIFYGINQRTLAK